MTDRVDLGRDVLDYYGLGGERARLATGAGRLELARTTEILERWLPPAAVVADVGGGDGRYADWLVGRGHRVELVEPVPLHVELARSRAGVPPRFGVHEGDARAVPLDDGSVDAVLLLGPLYHLGERRDRLLALREAVRICRPGGLVVAAAISRFAPLLDAVRRGNVDDEQLLANVLAEIATGRRVARERRTSPFPDAYFHFPDELEAELSEAGLRVERLLGVQGPGWLVDERDDAWMDDRRIERLARIARELEDESRAAVLSAHLLALGRAPG